MAFRFRFFLIITVAALCQWLSAQSSSISGNQLGSPAEKTVLAKTQPTESLRLPGGFRPGETVNITADTLSARVQAGRRQYVASGDVTIRVGAVTLSADRMSYDPQTGVAVASGHVAFDSPEEATHIEGTRADYDFKTSTGEFDNFQGTSGVKLRGRHATLVSNNPLIFTGRRLLRLGPDQYRLESGTITSCTVPHPIWVLSARSATFELGHNAVLHHAVFRLLDVPIFFAPYLTHSTTRAGRHRGLLLPTVSQSNIKGDVLGDSFYWPVARNINLTVGGAYYSARGWADHVVFDSRPTRNSTFGVELNGVFDRGVKQAGGGTLNQGGQELLVTGSHEAGSGWREVLSADYLSSYLYRLEFTNSFAGAINSEVISSGFAEKQSDGRDLSLTAHRYQDFLGTNPSASLSLDEMPAIDWQAYAQTPTRRLPVYFSWDFNAGLLDRSEPGFATGLMSRIDLAPTLSVPVDTPVGVLTGTAQVRSTYYSEHQDATTALSASSPPQLLSGGLWRNAVSGDLTWHPPALARVYSGLWGSPRLKHVIEPVVAYHFTGGVNNPNEVIRFNNRDILTNTSEIEYGVTNRLLAAGAKPGESRELIAWTLVQKYFFNPTFSGALVPGARNVLLTTEMLSPFSIEAVPTRFSNISSVIRVSPFSRFDGEWRLDFDSHAHQVAASAFTGNFHFGQAFVSGSQYLLHAPPELVQSGAAASFDQFRLSGGYGNVSTPGYSLAGAVAYDARSGHLQYTSVQFGHNWDCCGFTVEYRHFSLASVRRENQFLVSFSLANVGTFGNLKRQNGLF